MSLHRPLPPLRAAFATLGLAFLAPLMAQSPAPTPPAAKPAPAPLGSRVFDWQKLTVKPTKTGERRDIVDAPTATLARFESHVTTLRAGEVPHAAHRHPDEEIILIKEGTMEVTINGVTQQAGAGSMFFFASNDLHGMKNIGGTTASYYVIRLEPRDLVKPAAK